MTIEELYNIYLQHPQISTDSRRIALGSIFFALRGESFDGNRYAVAALESGAVVSVVDDASLVDGAGEFADRLILVDDVLTTLQRLAAYHREQLGIEILAITGSNGKTTTKELTATVLSQKYNLYATRGNLNNHIGVPLTLLSMTRDTQFGVVEMGASSCGEIALLCSIVRPNYGVVTNIGRAHLEGFGGADGVRRGKGELMDYLQKSGGVLFVSSECDVLMEMAKSRMMLQRVEYRNSKADGVEHNLEGEYNRYNIAAAVSIGEYFGVDILDIRSAIASYEPTNNRSQRSETERNTLVVDCYNANPSSMEVAVSNFAGESFANGRAKVLILGDMRELGEWSQQEHERVVEQALKSDAERIIFVGGEFRRAALSEVSRDGRVEVYTDREELMMRLAEEPISDCAVLIKGSRGVGLEQIVTLL